jgi:hypothetical protein
MLICNLDTRHATLHHTRRLSPHRHHTHRVLLGNILVTSFLLCTRRWRLHRQPHRQLARHCSRRVLLANIPLLLIREELR